MNICTAICSSLIKVFPDTPVISDIDAISMLKGERSNFQILLRSDEDVCVKIRSFFPAVFSEVKYTYSSYPIDKEDCGDIALENNGDPGYYPDLLIPSTEIKLKKNTTKAIWVETDSAKISRADTFSAYICCGDTEIQVTVPVKICTTKLPEQELIHINWFHSDCLATYYNVEVMSEDYWHITENFIKNAVSHGVNCILTPLFTPPLDTEEGGERPTVQLVKVRKSAENSYEFDFSLLERWVDMCLSNGVKYFELSHLFTQWGAAHAPKIIADTANGTERIFGWETDACSDEYMTFLSQLGKALTAFTNKKGITDICFVHCSDEPSLEHLEQYKKSSDAVRRYFSAYEHIDALSDFDFYKEGLISTPVPEEGNIEAFRDNVPSLWTYYCCGQYRNNLPNRFFALPSIKNRILGVLLYKYNCKGFLQWGYNFYYTQHSKRSVDPFCESDAGGAFPSGDSYIVYPGENGKPLSSLRQKVFYDGFQDIGALKALEKKYSREFVLDVIKESLGDITFTSYPLDNRAFIAFRSKVNDLLG